MIRCLPFLACLGLVAPAWAAADTRTLTFRYVASVGPIEAGRGPVHAWIPLAREDAFQRVLAESIDASIPGVVEREDVYGNRFWHGKVAASDGEVVTVTVETTVERRVHRGGDAKGDAEDLDRFLRPNERVAVGHPMLDPILSEIRERAESDARPDVARAIYDWVVENVEYKKVGSGWGNGDTFWACNERYGNCTDFHALFISLARTERIPSRFEIGFPVPEERGAGAIAGYHCWVQFHLPGVGWFPIDASEAFKHPEKRELFYGTHPADRIHLTTGRDLRLGADHRDRPLNYFVYPYVEVGGEAWQGPIEKSFSYRE